MVISHVIPRIKDLGISSVQAASILSILNVVCVPSRIIMGHIADRLGKRMTSITLALLHTLAMLWLMGCRCSTCLQ